MTDSYDWLFWILGGVLGLSALILLAWSLFADRSKGRKRCPKCWYEMTHSPGLTCSECGRTYKKEKKLLKTRRRWRCVVPSVIMLISSYGLAKAPEVYRDGWLRFIPTTALLYVLPESPKDGQIIAEELGNRIDNLELSEWQWQKLISKVNKGTISPYSIEVVSREKWLRGYKITANANLTRRNIGWKAFDALNINAEIESECKRGSPVIIRDPKTQRFAWNRSRTRTPNPASLVTKINDINLGTANTDKESIIVKTHTVLVLNYRKRIRISSSNQVIKIIDSTDSILKKVEDPNVDKYLYENLMLHSSPLYADYRTLTNKLFVNLITTGEFTGDNSDYTIPLSIELLLNGNVVSSTSAWLKSSDIDLWKTELGWEKWHDPTRLWTEEDKLSVRVKGDPGVALRNVDCDRYWNGEFVVPAYWIGNKWHVCDEVDSCEK